MTYLLDTNVLSESRKRRRDPGVTAWLAATPSDSLYLSVLSVGEIEQGVTRLVRRGDEQQAAALETWLDGLVQQFEGRICPVTAQIARQWGRVDAARPVPVIDGLIAATATVHGMTLVTRNIKDFERSGVRTLNPFAGAGAMP